MSLSTVDIPIARITGDECDDCARRLEDALRNHRGIEGVTAKPGAQLSVSYDPDLCSLQCLSDAATEIGIELERTFAHENRSVAGMDCYDCAQTIQRAASRIDGVVHCSVNFPAARMQLEYDAAHVDVPQTVERVVGQLGYQLGSAFGQRAAVPVDTEARPAWWRRHIDMVVTATSALFTVAAVVVDAVSDSAASPILYAVAIAIGGFGIARSGVRALALTRRFDINLLMAIAVVGAVAIDAWLEAALVVVLFRIGEALEHNAVDRARRSLHSLIDLAPSIAHRRMLGVDGKPADIDVPAGSLVVGDVVIARPGERIPADGTVLDGNSTVDQAAITGESMPVDMTSGAEVFAGTINGEGLLVIEVTHAGGDSTLDRVARAVADAQAQRSPAERWVDSFARVYTPIVLLVALAVGVFVPLLTAADWTDWIYRGLAFLILACPCALVIATPVATVAALSRAAQAGVLVKGGAHLETATKLRAIAMDKTGTITLGRPVVTDIVSTRDLSNDEVLRLAAAADAVSEHPLARAIVKEARARGLSIPIASEFRSVRGLGVTADVDGRSVSVSSPQVLADVAHSQSVTDIVEALSTRGKTVIVISADDDIVGVLGVADAIRAETADALRHLRNLGIEHTILLTGDHERAAEEIASQAGITDVRADLLPTDKVAALAEVQKRFGPTAMIGDGVNDAPALATAAMGIALGGAGSPAAIETADVVLMGDDLHKVCGLFVLARSTRRIVRQSIAFSLGTKAVAAAFALLGLLPLWLAVLADVGATLLVVVNGLRLLRIDLRELDSQA
jgi:Zn2+/Cd2+-exporting ATPase